MNHDFKFAGMDNRTIETANGKERDMSKLTIKYSFSHGVWFICENDVPVVGFASYSAAAGIAFPKS